MHASSTLKFLPHKFPLLPIPIKVLRRRCVGDGSRSRIDWELLVGNLHVGGLVVLAVDVLTGGQQHSEASHRRLGSPI